MVRAHPGQSRVGQVECDTRTPEGAVIEPVLTCTVLKCAVMCCIVLYCRVLYSTVLYRSAGQLRESEIGGGGGPGQRKTS